MTTTTQAPAMVIRASRRRLARRAALAAPAAVALAACGLFSIRNVRGWTFLPFGDEAGHLLGALAMHAGDVLYRDYIDAHGPVVFMLAQLYGALTGWHDLTYARLASTLVASLAAAAVAGSPALRGAAARLLAAALFLGVTASLWLVQALYMQSYHTVAGGLIVMALALFAAPAWAGRGVTPGGAFAGGAACALVGFTAYSYAPSALLIAASGLLALAGQRGAWRRAAGMLVLGALAGSAVVLVWLAIFGDIVGYVVFHIIANQLYYARYLDFSLATFLASSWPPVTPATLAQRIGVVALAVTAITWMGMAAGAGRAMVPRGAAVALGLIGIALLNARGDLTFQNGTFLMAAFGAAALGAGTVLDRWPFGATPAGRVLASVAVLAAIGGAELARRHAVGSPTAFTRAQAAAAPRFHYGVAANPSLDRLRAIVPPGERVLVLVYDPQFSLLLGRLPMRKYHAYLPWEADYARAPWFGRDRDLCVDLARAPPPAVYFDNWHVGGTEPARFMPCVLDILATRYDRQPWFPNVYVRKDVAVPPG